MRLKRILEWTTLALILILTVLSIYGAFVGAERTQALVNSVPSAAYWIVFLITLIAGCVVFKRLIRVPSLLVIHVGCAFVLMGGMWGSKAGETLKRQWFGRDVVEKGYLALLNGQTDNRVYKGEARYVSSQRERFVITDPDGPPIRFEEINDLSELPFTVELKTFRIERYPGSTLYVFRENDQPEWALPVEPDVVHSLGPTLGTLRIVRIFENLKVALENGEKRIYDDPDSGSNPAVEVELTDPNGNTTREYVFGRNRLDHVRSQGLTLLYPEGPVSDYLSEVVVHDDGKAVVEKLVEVNHPLYFGGYHLYQSSWVTDRYGTPTGTVLQVVRNTGLNWVYAGYILLCVGVVWQLGRSIGATLKSIYS